MTNPHEILHPTPASQPAVRLKSSGRPVLYAILSPGGCFHGLFASPTPLQLLKRGPKPHAHALLPSNSKPNSDLEEAVALDLQHHDSPPRPAAGNTWHAKGSAPPGINLELGIITSSYGL